MAVASKKYSGLDGLGASGVVFRFEEDRPTGLADPEVALSRIDIDEKVVAPSENDWTTAKDSDEALEAYNIVKYGRTTGETSINVADDDILDARYRVALANQSNVETGPRRTGTADRNFYRRGVITRPSQYQSPSSVRYGRGTSSGAYAYPLNIDLSQDHLQINRFEYTRDAANLSKPGDRISQSQGKTTKGTVILPMPKVSDSNGAEWGESDLNVFGVGAVQGLKTASETLKGVPGLFKDGFDIQKIKDNMQLIAPSGNDLAGAVSVAGALGGAELLKGVGITVEPDALLARSEGKIINPNAELLFQGPVLRDFGFQYLMVARSKEEGDQIRRIIRFFKEGAAPKYQSQSLLGTPDIFSLEYQTRSNPGILNKFHDMALRTITVDYAPDGFWSAYEDSQPVAVRMSLQFTELRPVYGGENGDYKGLKDNTVGY